MDTIEKSREQKRRSSFRKIKKVLCINTNKIYNSAKEAAKDLNIPNTTSIRACARGSIPHYKQYKFKYVT